jgi:hypothetical protein
MMPRARHLGIAIASLYGIPNAQELALDDLRAILGGSSIPKIPPSSAKANNSEKTRYSARLT